MDKQIINVKEGKGMSLSSLYILEDFYYKGYTILTLNDSITETWKIKQ